MGLKQIAQDYIVKPLAALTGYVQERYINVTSGRGLYAAEYKNEVRLVISAYFACIRNISEDVAKQPFRLLRTELKGTNTARIPVTDDPLYRLMTRGPNPEMTAFTFKSLMVSWACDFGTAFSEIQWNTLTGKPARLWPIHPSRVLICRDLQGILFYKVMNKDGSQTEVAAGNMFKFIGPSPDGILGYEMFALMRQALGIAYSTQNFTNKFFENNARPGALLSTDQVLKPETRDALKSHWRTEYEGSGNAGKTIVIDAGLKYTQMSSNNDEAQLLELRQFTVADIARFYRMPLHLIQQDGNAKGWQTLDADQAAYVTLCLMAWTTRFEEEIQRQLMRDDVYADNYDAHFESKGLLRGDLKARMEFYKALFFMGALTPNEIRMYEDMNPIDDPAMDKTYIQGATVPLALAGMMQKAGVAPTPDEPKEEDEEPVSEEEMLARLDRLKAGIERRRARRATLTN